MEPTKHSNKTLTIAIILIIVIAVVFMWAKNGTSHLSPQEKATIDPETSQVEEEATQDFSVSDDTASLEADLNASIEGLSQ